MCIPYRPLGSTGMEVSILGFGGIKLPKISSEEADRCLKEALDQGINFIDTARNYGDSEKKIGSSLSGRKDQFIIATKTTARDAEGARKDLETSLRELRLDAVDLYQLHTVSDRAALDRVLGKGGAYEALLRAKEEGLLRHIGVTIHRDLAVMKDAIASQLFETIMLAFSPLDQEGVGSEILPLARSAGMGTIIMKPLSGGQLVDMEQTQGVNELAREAIRYVLAQNSVDVAIPGMMRLKEVKENVETAKLGGLSPEELPGLMRRIAALGRSFRYGQVCLRCGYCQPCPQDIRIPDVFRALDIWQSYPESLKQMALDIYKELPVGPEACQDCGACVEVCPAGIDIPERLREAVSVLGSVAPRR